MQFPYTIFSGIVLRYFFSKMRNAGPASPTKPKDGMYRPYKKTGIKTMKTLIRLLAATFLALSFTGAALATDKQATPDEAVAMVKRAVKFLKENGREKAFAEFSNPKGSFVDRELYIVVFSMNGINLAHGNNTKIIGKNLIDMKDNEGRPIIRNFIDIAQTKGSGWFDYKWPNPVSRAVEGKSTYLEKYEDLIVGVGIYKG
jgi:cytochrome c